jgi:hypothetical protein
MIRMEGIPLVAARLTKMMQTATVRPPMQTTRTHRTETMPPQRRAETRRTTRTLRRTGKTAPRAA